MKHCLSCAAPLEDPQFKGASDDYCIYCVDEQGLLKPRHEVKEAITGWFLEWHPGADSAIAQARAEHYLQSMPAWSE